MRAGGGVFCPLLFSVYVNKTPAPSSYVEVAQYADVTALVATHLSPKLLVCYLVASIGGLQLWLRYWRTAISVSKSTAVFFC
jgi:hypothetical protein